MKNKEDAILVVRFHYEKWFSDTYLKGLFYALKKS